MKRILLAFLFLVISSPAFSQNISPNDEFKCYFPINNSTAPQIISIKSGYKIEWCVDGDYNKAISLIYTFKVDSNSIIPIIPACTRSTVTTCITIVPDSEIPTLQLPINHTVTIGMRDPVANIDLPSLILNTRRPVCIDNGIIYEVGSPIPVGITGALRNQIGMFTFETQIGKLRDEGFRIEWQRSQFGLDSNGLNGYNYMLGWCEGK